MHTQTVWEALLFVSMLGVIYPGILYPLLLLMLTRRRRQTRTPGQRNSVPGFTVIVPAHNEEAVIAQKLRNTLNAIAASGFTGQVIVAADGCTDRTCQIVESFASKVELIRVEQRGGIAGALKAGLRRARYDIVVFSDADILLDNHTYARMISHFANPHVGGVCGATRMVVRERSGLHLERLNVFLRTWIRERQSACGATIGADGANWAVRKTLIRWPANPQLAEDLVIPLEVIHQGYQFIFDPTAGAVETSPARVGDEYHRKVRTIAGGMQAGRHCRWMFQTPHWAVGFHYLSWKMSKYLISIWIMIAAIAVIALSRHSSMYHVAALGILAGVLVALASGLLGRLWPGAVPRPLAAVWYALVTLVTPVMALVSLATQRATVLWRMAPR